MTLLRDIWKHPANRGRRMAQLIRAARWQCWKRLTGRPCDIQFHGLTLRCFPDSRSASRAIYFRDYPDFREMRFIVDYLRPGDVFVDVGANAGLYTLLALSMVRRTGHVHSYEPGKRTFARLEQVLRLNDIANVTLHNVAASEKNGTVAFDNTGDDCTAHIYTGPSAKSPNVTVSSVRLDSQLTNTPIAMMKLDIEGHEPFALRGASGLLSVGNPPVIQVEMAGYSKLYGITTSDCIRELRDYGYRTAVYAPDSRTLEWTERPWQVPTDNVLAVCEARKDVVCDRIAVDRG